MGQNRLKRYKVINKNEIESALKALAAARPLEHIKFRGYPVYSATDRYENLFYHGCKCAKCGAEAEYAAIEKDVTSEDKFHLNAYVKNTNGKEVCLTKDHIYPRSLGGFDTLENYQVLCESCNTSKGDKTEMTVEEAVARGCTSYEAVAAAQVVQERRKVVIERESALAEARRELREAQAVLQQYVPKRDKSEFI